MGPWCGPWVCVLGLAGAACKGLARSRQGVAAGSINTHALCGCSTWLHVLPKPCALRQTGAQVLPLYRCCAQLDIAILMQQKQQQRVCRVQPAAAKGLLLGASTKLQCVAAAHGLGHCITGRVCGGCLALLAGCEGLCRPLSASEHRSLRFDLICLLPRVHDC